MKKITLALVAFMLVLGMTQCKKEQPTNVATDEGETVYITMKVTDDGAKHTVYPGTGAVVYGNGDKIYVGNNGHYVGTLTYANGAFSGTITSPSTSDYLHFYFTGDKTPATAPTAGSTESFTLSIADQSTNLPVLSYGRSNIKYVDGTTAYTCMLENKCGLVKFVPSAATGFPVSVSGMKTTATIDFSTPGITPTDATGAVTLYSVSDSEKWAILLPQNEVVNPNVSVVNKIATIESVPAVAPNMYNNNGVTITVGVPEGAVAGTFTINADGDQVWFSKGNLRYHDVLVRWRFADNQYDYVGADNVNIAEHYNGWIDLFGWGTSGFQHGAVCYGPWSTDLENSHYYAYGDGQKNLYDGDGTADWGKNLIINGGGDNNWRTLTNSEWYYLFSRNDWSLFGEGSVGDIKGMIFLPDVWTLPEGLSFTPNVNNWTNSYTIEQWVQMEANGAVFLPAAGVREMGYTGTINAGYGAIADVNSYGFYWTADRYNGYNGNTGVWEQACDLMFRATGWDLQNGYRCDGMSVRLVQDVQ